MPFVSASEPAVFVIRIWIERAAEGGGQKRGYVEHVASGERRYFSALTEAIEFVATVGAMPIEAPAPREDVPGSARRGFDAPSAEGS